MKNPENLPKDLLEEVEDSPCGVIPSVRGTPGQQALAPRRRPFEEEKLFFPKDKDKILETMVDTLHGGENSRFLASQVRELSLLTLSFLNKTMKPKGENSSCFFAVPFHWKAVDFEKTQLLKAWKVTEQSPPLDKAMGDMVKLLKTNDMAGKHLQTRVAFKKIVDLYCPEEGKPGISTEKAMVKLLTETPNLFDMLNAAMVFDFLDRVGYDMSKHFPEVDSLFMVEEPELQTASTIQVSAINFEFLKA